MLIILSTDIQVIDLHLEQLVRLETSNDDLNLGLTELLDECLLRGDKLLPEPIVLTQTVGVQTSAALARGKYSTYSATSSSSSSGSSNMNSADYNSGYYSSTSRSNLNDSTIHENKPEWNPRFAYNDDD